MYNAIANNVSVSPYEMPLPSALASHSVTLTLKSSSACEATYRPVHAPAASISLSAGWSASYNVSKFMQAAFPTASASFSAASIRVPAGGQTTVCAAWSAANRPQDATGWMHALTPLLALMCGRMLLALSGHCHHHAATNAAGGALPLLWVHPV